MRVVLFGTYDEDKHPRVRVLREGLLDSGIDVITVNVPILDSTAERISAGSNWVRAVKWVCKVLSSWYRIVRRSRPFRHEDLVIIGYLGVFDVFLAKLLFRRSTLILDHLAPVGETARNRGLGATQIRMLDLIDSAAVRCADIVLLDTIEHTECVKAREEGPNHLVVPVGAPINWFVREKSRDRTRFLRVIFFGLYTPLQGTATIGKTLSMLRDRPIQFTMVGRGQDYERCREAAQANDRVVWIEWIDPADLPRIVSENDVCLGIFGTDAKAMRVIPNKIYQGAAAGNIVVSGDSPPVRRLFGDVAILVPPGDHLALAAALDGLVNHPAEVTRLKDVTRQWAYEHFRPSVTVRPLVEQLALRGDASLAND